MLLVAPAARKGELKGRFVGIDAELPGTGCCTVGFGGVDVGNALVVATAIGMTGIWSTSGRWLKRQSTLEQCCFSGQGSF